ncbi:MAG: SAM-dependent methyltransferase [Cytophagales bacterium]|nr:SAM-dependent methyltransferase [Cytophagales bacterium]
MNATYEPRPEQSTALLQELHILTRDGKLNQDTRRKLKQVQHLLGFIAPLLKQSYASHGSAHVVDHGAGKSYLGFLLYDAYFKQGLATQVSGSVTGVETRADLVARSADLAARFGFDGMQFLNASVAQSNTSAKLPSRIDIVTALHACDTATDDAIRFALDHNAPHLVLVPCCQAEVAACLRSAKPHAERRNKNPLAELWRRPIHTREFGSQLTNVLRSLQLEAHGYQVTVTELVGWEHAMKNELIVASRSPQKQNGAAQKSSLAKLTALLEMTGLNHHHTNQNPIALRFLTGLSAA